jgi:hypothetical protein
MLQNSCTIVCDYDFSPSKLNLYEDFKLTILSIPFGPSDVLIASATAANQAILLPLAATILEDRTSAGFSLSLN